MIYVKTHVLNLPTTSAAPTIKLESPEATDIPPSAIPDVGVREEAEVEEEEDDDEEYIEDEEDEEDEEEEGYEDEADDDEDDDDDDDDDDEEEEEEELERLSLESRGDAGDGRPRKSVSTARTSSGASAPAQEKPNFEEDDGDFEEIGVDFNKVPVTEQDTLAQDADKAAEKEVQNSADIDW